SLGFLMDDRKTYTVIISDEDVKDKSDLAKFCIAHELGHLACGHVEEMIEVVLKGWGNNIIPGEYYNWRVLQEDEANVFAANMSLCSGNALIMSYLSDSQFNNNVVENLPKPPDYTPLVDLKDIDFRKQMRDELILRSLMKPPIPAICHALIETLSHYSGFSISDSGCCTVLTMLNRYSDGQFHHFPKQIFESLVRVLESVATPRNMETCGACADYAQSLCSEIGHPTAN
ncbi:MAG: hypothetical protein NTX50_25115, partial [Candidatus Sumerlaeota bacterium]|nr:hypothetical protein [Candidatus Sumerlaeota bacterium]